MAVAKLCCTICEETKNCGQKSSNQPCCVATSGYNEFSDKVMQHLILYDLTLHGSLMLKFFSSQ